VYSLVQINRSTLEASLQRALILKSLSIHILQPQVLPEAGPLTLIHCQETSSLHSVESIPWLLKVRRALSSLEGTIAISKVILHMRIS